MDKTQERVWQVSNLKFEPMSCFLNLALDNWAHECYYNDSFAAKVCGFDCGVWVVNDKTPCFGNLHVDLSLLSAVKLICRCRFCGVRGLLRTAMTCDDIKSVLVAAAARNWRPRVQRGLPMIMLLAAWADVGCERMISVTDTACMQHSGASSSDTWRRWNFAATI